MQSNDQARAVHVERSYEPDEDAIRQAVAILLRDERDEEGKHAA